MYKALPCMKCGIMPAVVISEDEFCDEIQTRKCCGVEAESASAVVAINNWNHIQICLALNLIGLLNDYKEMYAKERSRELANTKGNSLRIRELAQAESQQLER